MKLSVVIPVFNEKHTISEVIRRVRSATLPDVIQIEIVVVDDNSIDGTRELLRGELANSIDNLILHERNEGKGAALRAGFKAATGDFIVIQDADLEYDPADYALLLQPMLDGRADVVYGSRFKGAGAHRVLFFWHMLGNFFLTLLSNMLTDLNLSDMETCYKLFRREVLEAVTIEENRFGFEPEITAKIASLRCRIYEVGISYAGRTYEEGKKIGWRDGLRALYVILKYGILLRLRRMPSVKGTSPGSCLSRPTGTKPIV